VGPGCTQDVIAATAAERGAPLFRLTDTQLLPAARRRCRDMSLIAAGEGPRNSEDLNCDLAETALRLLRRTRTREALFGRLTDAHLAAGLRARMPCRFEVARHVESDESASGGGRAVSVVLDMAHNEAGIRALGQRVGEVFPAHKVRSIF
jgi:folylpolyglutamate synthase/dihydropteroate synthase